MRVLILLALSIGVAGAAAAKPARCYTSDDGTYACEFTQFGGDGSFVISAPVKPTYTLTMLGEGIAMGYADYGSGNRLLPGPFRRSAQDRACWVADPTGFVVCAY